jgi:O-antigen/teichoic acid export membrane protein
MIENFLTGDKRTVKIKKNILASFFLKGCSILVSFFLIPLTLDYLNAYEYGIWITLFSILNWINYFDIGLGNGLRNKLAEALAVDERESARTFVSTAFFLLLALTIIICILFFIFSIWLDWYKILNVSADAINNLNPIVSLVFFLFCCSFVLKIVGNVYSANQLPVINDLFLFCGNVVSLVTIFILTRVSEGDLFKVAVVYSAAPLFVYGAAWFVSFYYKYPYLRPSISYIRLSYAKDLMGLGVEFFIIQIVVLVIFSTSNIFITQFAGPEYVTPYNIAFKYFSVVTMVFNIIISPLWSAITEAYIKNDYEWIKRAIRRIRHIWLMLSILTIIMIAVSNMIYKIWIGNRVEIPLYFSVIMGVYVILSNWNNIYAYFLNGTGKIRLQLYGGIAVGILYVPLVLVLNKHLGIIGILCSTCIVLLPGGVINPIQYGKIIRRKCAGIWNK